MSTLIVSEVFGPTVQGEGPSMGQRCAFVRLGRCNLDCRWCDTPYTWDTTGKNGVVYDPALELSEEAVDHIVERLAVMQVGLVVISGGEPMLQRRGLTELVRQLTSADNPPRVEIETNGTQKPWAELWPAHFNVSPKLGSSGVEKAAAWKAVALQLFVSSERATFKFVVGCDDDLGEVLFLVDRMHLPRESVWIMAQTAYGIADTGMSPQRAAEWAIERGFNYTPRLHVQLWGERRGV